MLVSIMRHRRCTMHIFSAYTICAMHGTVHVQNAAHVGAKCLWYGSSLDASAVIVFTTHAILAHSHLLLALPSPAT